MRMSVHRSHAAEPTAPHLRRNTWQGLHFGMNALDEVPFQTMLGPLEVETQLVTAPDINIPDSHQILQDTEYGFNLEKLVLCGQQPLRQAPSCPPFWLMFRSPQEGRRSSCSCGDMWAPRPRSRSHSLNSADARWLHHRTVTFLISDSEDDDGSYEDNEGSSTEEAPHPIKERPRGTAPKDPVSRVKDLHLGSSTRRSKTDSPQSLRRLSPSLQEGRTPLRALEQHRSQPASPLLVGKKSSKKRHRSVGCLGRRFSQNTPPAALSPCRQQQQQQQQRPSSAGPIVKNRRQALSTGGSCGVFFDSVAELLSALSQEERELLETITERGYPLRTAILALQKTGYHSPEKILKYLRSRDRLCELGYDEAQVEEALEMFQNCESKAAEFLRLLTQFNEMGFQQSAIKEVLLVHENHRERALEELMTRMA